MLNIVDFKVRGAGFCRSFFGSTRGKHQFLVKKDAAKGLESCGLEFNIDMASRRHERDHLRGWKIVEK